MAHNAHDPKLQDQIWEETIQPLVDPHPGLRDEIMAAIDIDHVNNQVWQRLSQGFLRMKDKPQHWVKWAETMQPLLDAHPEVHNKFMEEIDRKLIADPSDPIT